MTSSNWWWRRLNWSCGRLHGCFGYFGRRPCLQILTPSAGLVQLRHCSIRWSKPSKQTSQFDRKIQVFEIDYFSRENSKNSLEIKINVAIWRKNPTFRIWQLIQLIVIFEVPCNMQEHPDEIVDQQGNPILDIFDFGTRLSSFPDRRYRWRTG